MTDASDLLRAAMDAQGITDNELRAGIAAIAGGESGFEPSAEVGYGKTSNARIRSIFAAAKNMTDARLDALKADDATFFEAMYGRGTPIGRQLGNTRPGDGYLYRGRGLLQLTGRANYVRYGALTGHPELGANPDLANDPRLAAAIAVAYMRDRYRGGGFDAMKRAVGNSFGTVDDRKNVLFRQYLASGAFNATSKFNATSRPAPAPAVAKQGEKPMTESATANTSPATAATPARVVPTSIQATRMPWIDVVEQFAAHEEPIAVSFAQAGIKFATGEIPVVGPLVYASLGPLVAKDAVDSAIKLLDVSLDALRGTADTVSTSNSVLDFALKLISSTAPTFVSKTEAFLDGWLSTALAAVTPKT